MEAMSEDTDWMPAARGHLLELLEDVARLGRQCQTSLVNWLFVVNAGGLAGLLTYAATKRLDTPLVLGLVSFFVGLFLIISFRVVMYYSLCGRHGQLSENIDKLDARRLTRPDYMSCIKKCCSNIWFVDALAWASGFFGLLGGILSAFGIQPPPLYRGAFL